ncbi:MAG TPA: serine hydrolase domain-containing protein [Ilumatobacteraceae bacterium]|nr:serine hydrolase domain-containing protein [Ilumatobacteraceae bacterium]
MPLTADLDRAAVDKLAARIARDVDGGLLPAAQFALALDGEVVEEQVFGTAGPDTRFCLFSATKPFVASTVWRLIAAGDLDPAQPVTTWFPAFGANGKEAITLEQVMLHTSGFPAAPMGPAHWSDRSTRQERMAAWRLNWEPGTRYEYHPTAAHWVLAELIEEVTGSDYRVAVHELVTGPLGLPRIVGIPLDEQDDIASLQLVGEHATSEELLASFGVPALPVTEVTDDAVARFNEPDVRAVGVPGGGGFARASDVARFYQALLHGDEDVWPAALLQDVTTNVRTRLPDPAGTPANRTLGLLVAGDDGSAHVRGFGRTVSPRAFGHNGAGGQIAWADPATGLSFAFVTNGYDRHEVRQPRRTTSLGSLAAVTAPAR